VDQRARRNRAGAAGSVLAFLAALLVILAALPQSGTAEGEQEHWTTVDLIYHSDTGGKIEPCG
jgi:hypothetical protein